jgi:hypothetical protein
MNYRMLNTLWLSALFGVLMFGCDQQTPAESGSTAAVAEITEAAPQLAATPERRFGGIQLAMPGDVLVANPSANAQRNAYYGDLHVHTVYSFDAFAFGTLATPYDAYRYARGEAIKHPAGFDVQLNKALDFYAVTDHAMFLGAVKEAADPTTELAQLPHVQALHNLNAAENLNIASLPQRTAAFSTFLPPLSPESLMAALTLR